MAATSQIKLTIGDASLHVIPVEIGGRYMVHFGSFT